MDDIQIVEMYLQRDEAAISQTAQQYGGRLRQVSYNIVDDHQIAEECENDTYLQAWQRIPPHEPKTYLYAFLARITRHLSIDRLRSGNRLYRRALITELSAELENCIPAPDDVQCRMEAQLLAEIISNFLKAQSLTRRNIFLRRYWYMDSIEDIARRFQITQSKVKSTLFRTRNDLRDHLEKEGYTL